MLNVAIMVEAAVAGGMLLAIVALAFECVRLEIDSRREARARAARLASPEYREAMAAAAAAWCAVKASRNADGYATAAAMDAWYVARHRREALQHG